MLTLGFTNHFYTLWSVNTFVRYGRGEVVNGVFNGESYLVTKYAYIQNLSMDYAVAKEKISTMAGDNGYDEDLSLRGEHGSFERTVRQIKSMADWQFTFGKLTGKDMRVSDDVWQLRRAMNAEVGGRRRVVARRRLIEMGELVRYNWTDRVFDNEKFFEIMQGYTNIELVPKELHDSCWIMIDRKYATKKQMEIIESKKKDAEMSGHFFEAGKRIEVKVKEAGKFSFDTAYGITFIVKLITEDGKMLKYKGNNPPHFENSDEFTLVKGTVEHGEYKGVNETRLKRIKVGNIA